MTSSSVAATPILLSSTNMLGFSMTWSWNNWGNTEKGTTELWSITSAIWPTILCTGSKLSFIKWLGYWSGPVQEGPCASELCFGPLETSIRSFGIWRTGPRNLEMIGSAIAGRRRGFENWSDSCAGFASLSDGSWTLAPPSDSVRTSTAGAFPLILWYLRGVLDPFVLSIVTRVVFGAVWR